MKSDADLVSGGLIRVVLYQEGKYPPDLLNQYLDKFFEQAENYICRAVRPNGGICYAEYLEEYKNPAEADSALEADIKNFEMQGGWGRQVADLLRLSREVYYAKELPLRDKIMLFDKVVHAEHLTGSIFGDVDIPQAKERADKVLDELDQKLPALLEMARNYAAPQDFAKAFGATTPDITLAELKARLQARKAEALDSGKYEEAKEIGRLEKMLPEAPLTLREVWEIAHWEPRSTRKERHAPRRESVNEVIRHLLEKAKMMGREEFTKYASEYLHHLFKENYELHNEVQNKIKEMVSRWCEHYAIPDILWAIAHNINPILYSDDGWCLYTLPTVWGKMSKWDKQLLINMFKFVKEKYPNLRWHLGIRDNLGVENPAFIERPKEIPTELWWVYDKKLMPEWEKLEKRYGAKAVSTAYSMFHELAHLVLFPNSQTSTPKEERECDRFALKMAKEFFKSKYWRELSMMLFKERAKEISEKANATKASEEQAVGGGDSWEEEVELPVEVHGEKTELPVEDLPKVEQPKLPEDELAKLLYDAYIGTLKLKGLADYAPTGFDYFRRLAREVLEGKLDRAEAMFLAIKKAHEDEPEAKKRRALAKLGKAPKRRPEEVEELAPGEEARRGGFESCERKVRAYLDELKLERPELYMLLDRIGLIDDIISNAELLCDKKSFDSYIANLEELASELERRIFSNWPNAPVGVVVEAVGYALRSISKCNLLPPEERQACYERVIQEARAIAEKRHAARERGGKEERRKSHEVEVPENIYAYTGKVPAWLREELQNPRVIAEILLNGISQWLAEQEQKHPDARIYGDFVAKWLDEHVIYPAIQKLRAKLETAPTWGDAVALRILEEQGGRLIRGGYREAYKGWGWIRVWIKRMAEAGEPYSRAFMDHIRYKICMATDARTGRVLKAEFTEKCPPSLTTRFTLPEMLFIMAIVKALEAIGADYTALPFPFRQAYEIFRENLNKIMR